MTGGPAASPVITARLRAYEALLQAYARKLGLVSPRDIGRIWDRHVLDALRVLECLTETDHVVADLGSGAGLPGVPVAIARPDLSMTLIEPMRRRASFLELVVDDLGLENVDIAVARAQDARLEADVVLARAFGSQVDVWRAARALLVPGGRVVYFAGSGWHLEALPPESGVEVEVEVCSEARSSSEGPLIMMREGRRG